jgi:hypothetical protein
MKKTILVIDLLLVCFGLYAWYPGNYANFKVSVYARAYEVREMNDLKKLEKAWKEITNQLKVDKIYLETHRDNIIVDDKTIEAAKKFFTSKGIQVAGGITYTINEGNHFETFCYSNPEHRKMAKEIAELTARHFDEFILDDFFFTSCKCDLCVEAKGDLSWTQFRLDLMTNAARDLIINAAKAVNPDVRIIIKYPNWYEHFQGLGFDLEAESKLFDGIYTGTETRDPVFTQQHLQQYESYLIFRYFENVAPGRNGGGWVDPGAAFYMDRYAEQLWLTLFAKAPEITLFDYRQLQTPLNSATRASWQGNLTSFDYDEMLKYMTVEDDQHMQPITIARAAGYTLEKADQLIGKLGKPVGIKSYRPFHSTGEDFLQNYFGMIGIPMDIIPEFPIEENMIILTESCKYDPLIVEKIKNRLKAGRDVMITSGLLQALQGKGIEDIVELRYTNRKAFVSDFMAGWGPFSKSDKAILIPQINYLTNDSWEDISAISGTTGWPVLHQAKYSKAYLYVLTIPDNFSDLYSYPPQVLNRIRTIVSRDLNVRIEGPSQVSLFIYDNETFIVESFLAEPVNIKVIVNNPDVELVDLLTGERQAGTKGMSPRVWGREQIPVSGVDLVIKPHSYKAFQIK